jgi:hypothetical protein
VNNGDPEIIKTYDYNPSASKGDLNDVCGNVLWGTKELIEKIIEFSDEWQNSGHEDIVVVKNYL